MGISTLTSKGTFTIPEEIRIAFGAQTGDRILVSILDQKTRQATFTIVPTKNVVEELAGSLHTPGMKYVPIEITRKRAGEMLGRELEKRAKRYAKINRE